MHPIKTSCCHRHGVSIFQRSHVQYRPLCKLTAKGEQIFTKLDEYKLIEEFLTHQPNALHLTHFLLNSLHHGRLHMHWKLEITTAALDHVLIISSGRRQDWTEIRRCVVWSESMVSICVFASKQGARITDWTPKSNGSYRNRVDPSC